MFDPDGGYASRKLHMSYIVMGLGSAGFAATGIFPTLNAAYDAYCMFLLGASGIYAGGNTLVKYFAKKKGVVAEPETPAPTKPKIDSPD